VTLAVKLALPFKFTDQTLPAEKTPDETFPGFTDLELQGVFKRDNVSRIDGV